MKGKWNIGRIIGLLLGIISLLCIVTSMVQEENNIFLAIGLMCNCISLVLFMLMNMKDK